MKKLSKVDNNLVEIFYYNKRLIQEMFSISMYEIQDISIVDFIYTYRAIHFIMQNIIMMKFKELSTEEIVYEGSAFDEYDKENGYEDDNNELWDIAKDNINRIIKLSRDLLKISYTECMHTDIYNLIEHLKFEIDNIDD